MKITYEDDRIIIEPENALERAYLLSFGDSPSARLNNVGMGDPKRIEIIRTGGFR